MMCYGYFRCRDNTYQRVVVRIPQESPSGWRVSSHVLNENTRLECCPTHHLTADSSHSGTGYAWGLHTMLVPAGNLQP